MFDDIKKYFEETPPQQIKNDWECSKEYDNIGITVENYLQIHDMENLQTRFDNLKHTHSNAIHRFFDILERDHTSSLEPREMDINSFILELLSVSDDKRNLPLKIQCPNGLEVEPKVKMKFENYGSSISGDKLESMAISW